MEIRCFLVHCNNTSVGHSYVDIPPPSSHSDGGHTTEKVLGRHSPELYWRVGNSTRYSRRMMSFWMEDATPPVEVPLNTRVHPNVPQRLMLKCLGKNALTVSRRPAETISNDYSPTGETFPISVRQNESVMLQVGDTVCIGDQVCMQVALAYVHVDTSLETPEVVSLRELNAASLSPRRVLFPGLGDLLSPPVVQTNRPWERLACTARGMLARLVWQHLFTPHSDVEEARAIATAPLSSIGQSPNLLAHDAEDGVEEAAAFSNSSQVAREDAPVSVSMSNDTRGKRHQPASPCGSQGVESQVISLDRASVQKKRRTSVADGTTRESHSPVLLPENSSYYETFDERLDDALRLLESRTSITNSHIPAGSHVLELLGSTPPMEGCLRESKKRVRGSTSITVSRTQLQLGSKQKEKELQPSSGHEEVELGKNAAADDSQVVYYRR